MPSCRKIRQLFALFGTADLVKRLKSSETLAFFPISLAILPDAGKGALLSLDARMRKDGRKVVYDGNYRPNPRDHAQSAAFWRIRAIAVATHGLPTLEDQMQIGKPGDAYDVAKRWQDLGCEEVVVTGAEGCLMSNGEILGHYATLKPVGTIGASDDFDAGYLSARLQGPTHARDAPRQRAGCLDHQALRSQSASGF